MKTGDRVIVSLAVCDLYGAHVVDTENKNKRVQVQVQYRDPRNGELIVRWVDSDEVRKG